jgi:transcriptional regulator with PAS, ATPase and Fis domain
MVRQRLFREDSLYRLSTITVEAPPQRARGPDVNLLGQHLVTVLNERSDPASRIVEAALQLLRRNNWPGNVRGFLPGGRSGNGAL